MIPQSLQRGEAGGADGGRVGGFEQGRTPAWAPVAARKGRRIGGLCGGQFDCTVEIGKLARGQRAKGFGASFCGTAVSGDISKTPIGIK
jgi:hypothetical protein